MISMMARLFVSKNREIYDHVVLNGNCSMMRNDRITDLDTFPLCEVLEADSVIKSVDLSYNRITDQGISPIVRLLRANQMIKHISLRGNSIGEKGARELAEALTRNRILTSLDLSENDLGESGALSILEMLKVRMRARLCTRSRFSSSCKQFSMIM